MGNITCKLYSLSQGGQALLKFVLEGNAVVKLAYFIDADLENDEGEHLASTDKVFTMPRHGSPNTAFETLIEQLFCPSHA